MIGYIFIPGFECEILHQMVVEFEPSLKFFGNPEFAEDLTTPPSYIYIYIIVHVDIIIYIGVDCPFVFKRVAGEIHMFVGDIMLYLYLNAYSELQFQGPECKPWRLGPH